MRAAFLRLGPLVVALLIPACGSSSGGGAAPALTAAPGGNVLLAEHSSLSRSVSDGAGGAFIVGQTFGSGVDCWIRRLSSAGLILWGPLPLTTSTASQGQIFADVVSDDAGGAIAVWADFGASGPYNLRAQRFSASGARLWDPDGIVLAPFPAYQVMFRVVADGSGGAIIAWQDERDHLTLSGVRVYAQRLDPSGTPLWGDQGLSTGLHLPNGFVFDWPEWALAPDAAGGALLAWRNSPANRLWQQRITEAGSLPWGASGRAVAGLNGFIEDITLTPRSGGAFAASWTDYRDFASTGTSVYVQFFDVQGDVEGSALRVSGGGAAGQAITTSDGAGGILLAFTRGPKDPTSRDLFAQRINAAGQPLWGPDGAPLGLGPDVERPRDIQALPDGGALVVWQDFRSRYDYDLYAGRVDGAGVPTLPPNGLPIALLPYDAYLPSAVLLSGGSSLIVWTDARGGPDTAQICYQVLGADGAGTPPLPSARVEGPWHARNVPAALWPPSEDKAPVFAEDGQGGMLLLWNEAVFGDLELRAQRVDSLGQPAWGSSGALIREETSSGEHRDPMIVSDGSGGAYVLWSRLDGGHYDILGQRIDADGDRLWPAAGLPLVGGVDDQYLRAALPDGAGGLYAIYDDESVLRVRRFDGTGSALWAGAVALVPDPGASRVLAAKDGVGGLMVLWDDNRDGSVDLYGQRVDPDGNLLWTSGGSGVETVPNESLRDVAEDGSGGLLVIFAHGGPTQAGVRRVDASGAWTWTSSVFPPPSAGDQQNMKIVPDGSGGAFVLCSEDRSGSSRGVLRRLDAGAGVVWEAELSSTTDPQTPTVLLADGSGGVYAGWAEESRVFAQRFNAGGSPLWTPSEGLRLSSASSYRHGLRGVVSPAGLTAVWVDARRGSYTVPYAQTIPPDGQP